MIQDNNTYVGAFPKVCTCLCPTCGGQRPSQPWAWPSTPPVPVYPYTWNGPYVTYTTSTAATGSPLPIGHDAAAGERSWPV